MGEHDRIAELERRVAALERHLEHDQVPASTVDVADDERFWALHALQKRLDPPGGVVFTGAVNLPPGEHLVWQWGNTTADLLDRDWASAAPRLAALAHPVRIELLRYILRGVRSTAELAGLEVMGTTGQLYHHLNQLTAAGWLHQTGRGRYAVPVERVVPLLVVLSATFT
jgi:hypothetical protein